MKLDLKPLREAIARRKAINPDDLKRMTGTGLPTGEHFYLAVTSGQYLKDTLLLADAAEQLMPKDAAGA